MSEPYNDEDVLDIHALVAMVERLNRDKQEMLKCWANEVVLLKEQNAKLKEDYYAPSVTIDELRKENAKLTAELDAALKRIEEMEGINHKWKN